MKAITSKYKYLSFLLFFTVSNVTVNASVISFNKGKDGVTCVLEKGLMKVKICTDNLVEVKYTELPVFLDKPSLVVVNDWETISDFDVTENATEISIATKMINVIVNKQNNSIKYTDLKGKVILSEDELQGKTMTSATIAGIDTYNCTSKFNSPADESLYGLGCHPEDSLSINYKGRNQNMTIKYMTGAIPVLLSTKGYGLMWDNYSASSFYGAENGNTKFKYESESGNMVDYYFIYGPSFDKIIA